MDIRSATDASAWDAFLSSQTYRPFMQSWTMGDVYGDIGEQPLRLAAYEGGSIVGICQALVVPARRGKHLSVPYGPVCENGKWKTESGKWIEHIKEEAKKRGCSFIRLSPFWRNDRKAVAGSQPAPMHLLAEHIWYIPLMEQDAWEGGSGPMRKEEEILMGLRKTTRNLVRRAEKEGVTVEASEDPVRDLPHFITLHDETRKRHGFTPYTNDFFRAQVARFAPRNECTLYMAKYQGEVIAASIHMHVFGETSYHHGASTHKYDKIPASYLLQWTAVRDALRRGDRIYSFWGVAPLRETENGEWKVENGLRKHPFTGVTTFKTGFGGKLLPLVHCMDIPVTGSYYLTRAFETVRKWKRGF